MKQAGFFALGFVVGATAVSLIVYRADIGTFLSSGQAENSPTVALPPESGAVAVSDQRAGDSVVVDSVTVEPPGVWVAVAELEADGSLGNVLGAELARGPRSNLTVSLLRSTLPTHRYAVVLYRDNGNGTFTLGEDSVYIDFNTGGRVIAPFTALAH